MPDIKGSVTITYDPTTNTHSLTPQTGLVDRAIQRIQWSLVAPAGWRFTSTGIQFRTGDGFANWPGTTPERDEDGCQMTARVNKKLPSGTETYRYDIWVEHDVHGVRKVEELDPDIENQPQP